MSRFAGTMKGARERRAEVESAPPAGAATGSPVASADVAASGSGSAPEAAATPTPAASAPAPILLVSSEAHPSPPLPRRGRPPGKRSDPDHVQATAYIPRDVHLDVGRALIDEAKAARRKPREFSELVAELLLSWLESRR